MYNTNYLSVMQTIFTEPLSTIRQLRVQIVSKLITSESVSFNLTWSSLSVKYSFFMKQLNVFQVQYRLSSELNNWFNSSENISYIADQNFESVINVSPYNINAVYEFRVISMRIHNKIIAIDDISNTTTYVFCKISNNIIMFSVR